MKWIENKIELEGDVAMSRSEKREKKRKEHDVKETKITELMDEEMTEEERDVLESKLSELAEEE